MNIIIYTVLILTILYFFLRFFASINSKKISKSLRILLFLGLIIFAVLFAVAGKFLLTLPLTIASLALLKLKGLSLFQLISLYRLIQTLRNSGRFSFNNRNPSNLSTMSTQEAYRILNLNPKQSIFPCFWRNGRNLIFPPGPFIVKSSNGIIVFFSKIAG